MTTIFEVIIPVFGLILLGYMATRWGSFPTTAARSLSTFVFDYCLPALLFRNMAQTDLPDRIEWGFLVSYYGAAFLVFGLSMIACRILFKTPSLTHPIHGLGAAFSNVGLLGIPLVLSAFGPSGAVPLFMIIACHSTLLLTTAIVLLETETQPGRSPLGLIWQGIRSILTNPIIMALAAGALLNLAGLALPSWLETGVTSLSQAALPTSTFALGATLASFAIGGHLGATLTVVGLKLLIHPLIVWGLMTFVFPAPLDWIPIAITLAALPTGVNVYLLGSRYDVAQESAAAMILFSTLLSLVSLSLVLALILPT